MSERDGYAKPEALVSTTWVAENAARSDYRLIEVDVDPANYSKGHIEGAIGWDWKRDLQDGTVRDIASREALAERLGKSGVTPQTTIVLYGDTNNWFAAYAYWALQYYGHPRVKLMDGGRVKWEAEGRPYSTVISDVEPARYSFPEPVREELRAFRGDVLAQLGSLALVDVRSPAEYSGELLAPENLPQEGAQRGGHIPTAVNVPWASAVDADGTFKSASDLASIYSAKGVTADRDVVSYCRIGERSAHTWFVLTELLGYPNVRNYDGSWTEWGSAVRAPIEK
jgi:thiosulfate/3-mercaptopyruvate sulfurtransferase